jgi:hypothetical protein
MITLGLVPAMLALPYRIREARARRRARQMVVSGVMRPTEVRLTARRRNKTHLPLVGRSQPEAQRRRFAAE